MEKKKHNRGTSDAVAAHDGREWRLYVRGAAAGRGIESPSSKFPQELAEAIAANGCRSVRFMASGDVHRMDGEIPARMPLAAANTVIRQSIAEATGGETDDLVVAGQSIRWGGARKPFTLAAHFDAGWAEEAKMAAEDGGAACAGFASMEMAILAAWTATADARNASLAVVGQGQSFVAPAQRRANPGPQSVPCGVRHFVADRANWISRFQRSAAAVPKDSPLHAIVLADGPATEIAAALRDAGYSEVVEEDAGVWIAKAAETAVKSKPNRTRGVAVAVANPYEPRKRFSNWWIAAAAAAILFLPLLYGMAMAIGSSIEIRKCAVASRQYMALDRRMKSAKAALSAAQKAAAAENASQKARIGARRPLVAFIGVARFFCKHSGGTLVLDAIEQKGDAITVRGTFTDPEDGVRLGSGLLEYARGNGVRISKSGTSQDGGEDDAFASRFLYELDCSKVGEAVK